MKKKKRLTAASLVLCLGVALLAGCSSSGGEDSQNGSSVNRVAKEITLLASKNWIKDVDIELFEKFEEETGIRVQLSLTPDNEYVTLLGTTLSGGSDAIDIFMYDARTKMISAGIPEVAVDLSDEPWVERMEQWAVDDNTADGRLIGFSTWGVDYEGILYNKTYFEENNLEVPTTWDGFIDLCDQIKELGKIPLYEPINGTWHTESWLYGMSPVMEAEMPGFTEYLNEGPENKFADITCFREGIAQLQELLSAKDGNAPRYYTNDGQAEDFYGSYTSLKNRETVMMFTWSAYASELKAYESTDEWGMFPLPLLDNQTAVSNGGGISKFINKNSKNIDECKQLFEFLAEDENLETYYAARTDLVTSAFKDVESVSQTTATADILERTAGEPEVVFTKDVLFWDPDVYQYLQGLAEGTITPDELISRLDEYRAVMFESAAE